MKLGTLGRFGLGLIAGAALGAATGCASTAGWGPAPLNPAMGAPHPTMATTPGGAPRFGQTAGMQLTKKEEAVKVPSWIRVQDCAIVSISSPSRYACPDGKVYTNWELYRARTGS
jgi:hypothetical protein